ncbi:cytochrome ubiquinol oxidase subunit I [Luteimonas sp. RD2P54]|uniref:Cytochrome ubiquinol oxidase subunit I n=1 Tax=Luteimonas endophytica TaxID=3042023 RepID=A0ABT6JE96_9GAMM|nr:cytochrome ubiquinol oxidase subunit I [Luteimonas endophytica]MDH5824528.1 cytochrome ubiquinol oxidase subunit I [Luteimonas endophytica]
MDALLLSRIQFGFVISFHVLFPAFTIGLSSWLAFLEWRWLRTRDPVWRDLYFFWLRIFAVSFGMGVVSGIVMSFQFGTNWSVLSERAGNILGPLLSYEVLTAFFLEATFLGVMLFGWRKVPEKLHFLATCMVAVGTLISTFWIISANSWLHTPAGYELVGDVFHPSDWWAAIFNPSFPYRLAHMVLAAFITTCFVIGGVGAGYLRRGAHADAGRRMLRAAVVFAALTVPLQVVVGDVHGLKTREFQPTKVAAMEGHWERGPAGAGVPLVLFAVPDQEAERNRYELAVPRLGSLILTHSWDGEIQPLTAVPRDERPPVAPVFYGFRIMVGLGMAMLLLTLGSLWALWRGRLFGSRWLLDGWRLMTFSGFVAVISGWFVAEIGRQPWVIQGLLRTADAVSAVGRGSVVASLTVFVLAYAVVFGAGAAYIVRMVRAGPQHFEDAPDTDDGERTPMRPISAADEPAENAPPGAARPPTGEA